MNWLLLHGGLDVWGTENGRRGTGYGTKRETRFIYPLLSLSFCAPPEALPPRQESLHVTYPQMSDRISFLGVNKTGKLRKENEAKKVKKSSMLLYSGLI